MTDLSIQEKIIEFKKANPELKVSKDELISIMVKNGVITNKEAIVLFAENTKKEEKDGYENFGLKINHNSAKEYTLPVIDIDRDDAQNLSIDMVGETIKNAKAVFKSQKENQGGLSIIYSTGKEMLKTDLSYSKVKKVIALEEQGFVYMNEAKNNNLTKKEYYEHLKEDLFLITPGLDRMSDEAKANVKQRIASLTIEEIKFFEKKALELPKPSDENLDNEVKSYLTNFKKLTEEEPKINFDKSRELPSMQIKSLKIKDEFVYPDGNELIKFEEVFGYERETSFNKEKVAKFSAAQTMLQLASYNTEKVKKIHSYLDNAVNNPRDDWQAGDYAKLDMSLKLALEENFGKDEEAQKAGLKKMLGRDDFSSNLELAKSFLSKLDENYEAFMQGRTLEDYSEDYAKSYIEAFGRKNSEQLAKAYEADNESITDKATGFVQGAGMTMMLVGGVMCLIPTGVSQAAGVGTFEAGSKLALGANAVGSALVSTGGKLALGGMAAQTGMKALNEASRGSGMSKDAKDEIIKEGFVNLATFAVGAGAGLKGAKTGAKMLAGGSSKFAAIAAERGVDVTLSIAGDLILTGDLNIEGNTIGQITALVTGIKAGKSINKHLSNSVNEKNIKSPFGNLASKEKSFNSKSASKTANAELPASTPGNKVSKVMENTETKDLGTRIKHNDDVSPVIKPDIDLSKVQFIKKSSSGKNILTPEGEKIIRMKAEELHNSAKEAQSGILEDMKNAGLIGSDYTVSHRPKSVQSLFDKIKNEMIRDESPAGFDKAVKTVRDAVGVRTLLSNIDYKNYPEIAKMLKTNPEKAYQMAAEKQSEIMVDKISKLIKAQAEGKSPISAMRLTNYSGKDGIAYFSDAQVAYLRDFALENKINLQIKDETTKIRSSGYTALQMNFVTKDGFVYEWQLRGKELDVFGNAEHIPYDLRENKDITQGNPKLKELYAPIIDAVKMTDTEYKKYNNYLTDYYKYLRKKELGFDAEPPKLENYGNFDNCLSADNLIAVHEISEKIKKETK